MHPRIHGELLKLGIDIGESSLSKYMVRGRKPPSQTWSTFLDNHLTQLVSVDFFTVLFGTDFRDQVRDMGIRVQALPPNGTNHPLDVGPLPRRARRGQHLAM